jgi:hypothetical protein
MADELGARGKGRATQPLVAGRASRGVVEGGGGEAAQARGDLARELVPAHLQGLERALAELHGQRAVEVVVGEHQVLERPALHHLRRQRACDLHVQGEVAQARQGGPGRGDEGVPGVDCLQVQLLQVREVAEGDAVLSAAHLVVHRPGLVLQRCSHRQRRDAPRSVARRYPVLPGLQPCAAVRVCVPVR